MDSKIINHKRYYRYEYHGKMTMPKTEAKDGCAWFRKKFSTNFKGKVVGTIRMHKEKDGTYSLWYRDSSYKEK